MDWIDMIRSPHLLKRKKGQALAEMVLSIPVLFIFAAAIFQFALLFLSYVQFEHACGEAAREFAAGLVEKDALGPEIISNLGRFQRFFIQDSLNLSVRQPHSIAVSAVSRVSNIVSRLNNVARSFRSTKNMNFSTSYEGFLWNVDIKFKPPAFFRLLFPAGIDFRTTMETYRYSG